MVRLAAGLVLVFALIFSPCYAQAEDFWFSPLTAVAVGPAGPPSSLVVAPHSSPSTALVVKATEVVTDLDFQWVNIGLVAPAGKSITGLTVCYDVDTVQPGATYISQVRLTRMTLPSVAGVIIDYPTDLTSTVPVCKAYAFRTPPPITGTITLALKMVVGNTADSIKIGGIRLTTN